MNDSCMDSTAQQFKYSQKKQFKQFSYSGSPILLGVSKLFKLLLNFCIIGESPPHKQRRRLPLPLHSWLGEGEWR